MLRKRSPPMIGKLSQLLVSGGGRAVEAIGSPRGPLDTKMMMMMQSPPPTRGGAGFKSYDLGGRVGLKIVVALDKSTSSSSSSSTDDDDDEKKQREIVILPKKHAVCCTSKLNQQRSGPIPVNKNPIGFQREEEENSTRDQNIITNNHINILEEEEYTYVTCHVPNKTFTKVYYDAGYNNNAGVLTTPQFVSPILIHEPQEPLFPTSNFLSSCHLCGKKLHGKDIYMYRGEKGFCSTECRSSQIMMDERKERCGSEASRKKSVELSTSLTNDQIFSTGILAI